MLFYVVFAAFVGNAFGAIICDEGWTLYEAENTCMKTFRRNTFHDARANCQAEGGDLVVIHDGVKNKFAVDMIETQRHFWIGLWAEHKGHWTYVDGNALVYKNWQDGEPNNPWRGELCAVVYNRPDAGEARGTWYDIACGYTFPSVCEKDSVRTCDWLVKVTTSNRKYSDTGDLVQMSIIGDDIFNATSYHVLKTESGHFELGATDEIRFKSNCLTPKAIKLELEGWDKWRADKVVLQRINYDKDKNTYIFNCNCWLDGDGPKYISL